MLNCINDYNDDSTKYFSWGDTIGKNKNGTGSYSFSQANYKAGVCGSGHNLTTGDVPQGNATYDAATANMSSLHKMPTKDQYQELIAGTNYTWTTINGVNGGKFTSKTDSNMYIFLQAGGFWVENPYGLFLYNLGETGDYWCTKLYSSSQGNMLSIYSGSATADPASISSTSRYRGLSVRAIHPTYIYTCSRIH